MKKFYKNFNGLTTVLCTVVAVVLICTVIVVINNHVYHFSEEASYEQLHMETQQIKRDINLQMYSDRENLIIIANFVEELHSDGKGYELVFDSFEKIGLFENIGILQPDNHLITKVGNIDLNGKVSFAEEAAKGAYISGRVKDWTNDTREIVRSAVPVEADNGEIIAMIYGIIELKNFKSRYIENVHADGADLLVVEGGNGNLIINTRSETYGNITEIAYAKFTSSFSYEKMVNDMTNGISGFSAFVSPKTGEILHAHYAPLDFADWNIMLMKPEVVVLSAAYNTESYMMRMAMLLLGIMLMYIISIFAIERKKLKVSSSASEIRKCLLEVNQQFGKIYESLRKITEFSKSRSAFVVDTYGEDYNYIVPSMQENILVENERKYFIDTLFYYASMHKEEYGADVSGMEIRANGSLKNIMPEFYDFLNAHNIHRICFALITNNSSNTNLLGVVNPQRKQLVKFLKDIAVCITMAVYNKKHLTKTEAMAVTDALTGVANRMAYNHDIKELDKKNIEDLICIYVDVNELNYYNNTYGHAAGDQMLVFIAETLRAEFANNYIYRMGGDEFLIFAEGIADDELNKKIAHVNMMIEEMKYHISIGIKRGEDGWDVEKLLNESEKIMYENKAKYYQNKGTRNAMDEQCFEMKNISTGIPGIDAYLSVLRGKYYGVYAVSMKNDSAVQLIAPALYFNMANEENKFSDVFKKYIHDNVAPGFHRTLMNFMEYDVLSKQLKDGLIPAFTYTETDGSSVTLSVYHVVNDNDTDIDALWIFEKDED